MRLCVCIYCFFAFICAMLPKINLMIIILWCHLWKRYSVCVCVYADGLPRWRCLATTSTTTTAWCLHDDLRLSAANVSLHPVRVRLASAKIHPRYVLAYTCTQNCEKTFLSGAKTHLKSNTSICVAIKTFETEFWKFYRKESFFFQKKAKISRKFLTACDFIPP